MPIQEQNIKFVESQVMDDVPEGGGAATGREVPDGVMNNVFEDISDLDRAMGRFNLRKLFVAVRTLSTDLFGGAKTVVTALPEDPAIGYTLFTTNDPFDTRAEAANRVESYLFKGPMWHGALYENHIAGMRQIRIIQRDENTTLPPRGKTLCLVQNEGQPNEIEQYVRVTDVSTEMQTFTDSQGDFQRLIVTLDLSDSLRHDFNGHTPSRTSNYNYTTGARLRDTTVADATRYFGAQRLTAAANIGDLKLKAASIFTQLVPAAQSEEPVTNQSLNPEIVRTINAGTRDVDVPQQAHSWARVITPENRSRNIVQTLSPVPAPGSLNFSFMAQGNFYTLTDNGEGQISGSDPSIGVGTIDYTTGAVSVTMGALPDVGSSVIMIFASPVHFEKLAGHADIDTTIKLEQSVGEPIKPGSLTLTWLAGGATKTATAAVDGTISGDATGYVSHVAGEFVLELTTPPDPQTKLGVDYEKQTAKTVVFTGVSETDGMVSLNIGEAVEPGTLEAEWYAESIRKRDSLIVKRRNAVRIRRKHENSESTTRRYHYFANDDGAGGWTGLQGGIDYQTGVFTLAVLPDETEKQWSNYSTKGVTREWSSSGSNTTRFATGTVTIKYVPAGATATAVSTELDLPPLQIRVLPRLLDIVTVQGSVEFTWNGKSYIDRQGVIYTDIQSNGSGTPVGSIDYLSGIVTLDYYDTGSGPVEVTSLLGVYGDWFTDEAFFRAPSAPLIPQSLQVLATTIEGELISASSDQDGNIVGDRATGQINYQYGTANVKFGQLVDDSTLTAEEKAEPWYDPANVDENGMIWKPTFVQPGTMRYNAVAVSYLPLDADIVGIDAVRLPADGRVPIYRPGDVVMVMHPQETAPQTVSNGDIITTRPRVGWVRVIDADGNTVTDGYTLDRATGEVTFTDVSGIAMPVTLRHTVADLRLVTDVQITGDITLSRPLTHDYPAGESIVASCLIHGDRRARVSATWDQKTWDGTWQDVPVGDEATATLNTIAHPITVTNEGAETERWVLRWINSTTVELIGQRVGLVYTGPFTEDIAPINPRTRNEDGSGGVPYLTIPAAANGGGWSAGNVVRINTVGALADFWIARAIQQSDEPLDDGADGCELHVLGNIDRP